MKQNKLGLRREQWL